MKKAISIILCLIAFVLVFTVFQRLVTPKYITQFPEGSLVSEYYTSSKDHDVIFIGDCDLYEGIIPIKLWENYGINAYVRGTAQQQSFQTYYFLKETLKYEKPKAIVINIQEFFKENTPNEAYNHMAYDNMKWSFDKLSSLKKAIGPNDNLIYYIFPLFRFHNRINELTSEDFSYFFKSTNVSHSGYLMKIYSSDEAELIPETIGNVSMPSKSAFYLNEIKALCEKNSIELILIKTPVLYPAWSSEQEEAVVKYAKENQLTYYNCLETANEFEIDYSTDTYNNASHLNLNGAEKLTAYIGKKLIDNHNLTNRKQEEKLSKAKTNELIIYNASKEEILYLSNFANENYSNNNDGLPKAESYIYTDAEITSIGNNDFYIILDEINGFILYPNQPVEYALGNYGTPQRVVAVDGCAGLYTSYICSYDNYSFETYEEDNRQLIAGISLKNDLVSTAEGLSIGDSVEKAKIIYGANYIEDGNIIYYKKENSELRLSHKNGVITLIEYVSSKVNY